MNKKIDYDEEIDEIMPEVTYIPKTYTEMFLFVIVKLFKFLLKLFF